VSRAVDLSALKLDRDGLVTVVVQDRTSGEVRMLAHADASALRLTSETGYAHFYSRSRGRLWKKGEESGNTLRVVEIWIDCDADAVVYLADPDGPTCHTGAVSCFFRRLHPRRAAPDERALPVLAALASVLEQRKSAPSERSYTRSLLDAGAGAIGDKVREEADELARAVCDESDERVVSEAADLVYHLMVALVLRGVPLERVEQELARRFGVSGHDEKASR
jgi:phosphoribosyl-AMP cyclohydrolase / phosphoribosyl-ATP pyrophosphohydrolase